MDNRIELGGVLADVKITHIEFPAGFVLDGDAMKNGTVRILAAPSAGAEAVGTPSSRWATKGEADPHGKRYDCERAALAHGDMTDDELANAVFLCDHRRSLESIGLVMATKDRIRWLSRQLTAPQPDAREALVEQWRQRSRNAATLGRPEIAKYIDKCADELAALAGPRP